MLNFTRVQALEMVKNTDIPQASVYRILCNLLDAELVYFTKKENAKKGKNSIWHTDIAGITITINKNRIKTYIVKKKKK